jgi:hypothetical protein
MDRLFQQIESWHNGAFGKLLDAGTGGHSLSWICDLSTDQWSAVTGDSYRAQALRHQFSPQIRPQDEILYGNWENPKLLIGQQFDVVIADYLLGALDGFAPYYQNELFYRLLPLVKDKLYIVGLSPYPDPTTDKGGRLILELARLRDACILLAGHRCYREYPLSWVLKSLKSSGYKIQRTKVFPIQYGSSFFTEQLSVAESKLNFMSNPTLKAGLSSQIEDLRYRIFDHLKTTEFISFGEDYLVEATPQ